MKTKPVFQRTSINTNQSTEGESLEMKLERIMEGKEPIKDGAPLIYTERSEGVKQAYNIRTDRWEVAIDGIDKIQKSYQARREEKAKAEAKVIELNGGAEPMQGTN